MNRIQDVLVFADRALHEHLCDPEALLDERGRFRRIVAFRKRQRGENFMLAGAGNADGEKNALFERDPLPTLRAQLIDAGEATQDEIDAIERSAGEVVAKAIAFARAAPEPAPEEALEMVFV